MKKQLDYQVFRRLLGEALEYKDFDMFAGERGWQDWMGDYCSSDAEVMSVLETIYFLAKNQLRDWYEAANFTRAQFSMAYQIPKRTIEDWDNAPTDLTDYKMQQLAYTFFAIILNGKKEEN